MPCEGPDPSGRMHCGLRMGAASGHRKLPAAVTAALEWLQGSPGGRGPGSSASVGAPCLLAVLLSKTRLQLIEAENDFDRALLDMNWAAFESHSRYCLRAGECFRDLH